MIGNNNMGALQQLEGCLGRILYSQVMTHKKDIDGENSTHLGNLPHRHDDEASHEMIGNSYHSMRQIKIRACQKIRDPQNSFTIVPQNPRAQYIVVFSVLIGYRV
jgi:hypothetical protein